MDSRLIAARLAEIEQQLKVLRAQLIPEEAKPKRFADLYGIWRGISNFSYEEIKAAEYKLKDDL